MTLKDVVGILLGACLGLLLVKLLDGPENPRSVAIRGELLLRCAPAQQAPTTGGVTLPFSMTLR